VSSRQLSGELPVA
jgi:hypothetical protein